MNRLLAALAACLVLFAPSLVLAQPAVQPYVQPPSGAAVPLKGDATGNLKVTEQFPAPYQIYQEVLFNSTIAAGSSASENLNPVIWTTAHLYPIKAVRLRVAGHTIGAAGVNGPLVVRVRGGWDGVNFAHIGLNLTMAADTLSAGDTLQYLVWSNAASPSPNGRWHKLAYADGTPLPFPYLQFALINRGSATDSVLIEVAGRQQ